MAQYVVGLDSSLKRLYVWKTTGDPTTLTNWSAQDRGISLTHRVYSMWAVLDGTDIHVATGTPLGAGQTSYWYHRFDTTTDEWAGFGTNYVDEGGTAGIGADTGRVAVSIAARTSDVILLFQNTETATLTDTRYAYGDENGWTQASPDSGASDLRGGAVIVSGASDRQHFFWFNDDNDDVIHRSLSSGNVLDTIATVDAAVGASVLHPIGRGISYPDNGNTVIKVPYLDADESITGARIDVSEANPTIATDTAASDNDAEDINSSVVACYALDTDETYLMYSGGGVSGVDQDIYYDSQADGGSWGTDTEEQDAVTCNRISCAVYDRSGNKIGYVWLDGTTTSYDEIDIAGVAATSLIYDRRMALNANLRR